jgi:hypothetical protein
MIFNFNNKNSRGEVPSSKAPEAFGSFRKLSELFGGGYGAEFKVGRVFETFGG